MNHYDLIIIGAGAGGGTVAYALAPTGKRILILERGGYIPQEEENWNPDAIFQGRKYQVQEKWLDKNDESFLPQAFYNVGGNTKVYGAALQRMRAEDFQEVKHLEGISPAWELSYQDFEPYYTRAESIFKIHGQKGEDISEPPMSVEYTFPAIPHEPRLQEVAEDLGQLGLHPHHLTLAIDRNVADPETSPCIRCATCDPYPCKIDAKMDAQKACIDRALEYANVELKINAKVNKLITDKTGQRVSAAVVEIDGDIVEFSADTFILAAGSINSAALLLKSANEQHPHGLANSSGMVGRNLMLHNHSAMFAIADKPNPTKFQKTLGFNDFYFGSQDHNYPLGQIQMTGKSQWNRLAIFSANSVPKATLEYMAEYAVDWWLTSEDLPDPNNRISLTNDGQIKVDFTRNNLKAHQDFVDMWQGYLRQIGFYFFIVKQVPLSAVWLLFFYC
ncbi:choline dehydrogenase-like flavoprotein [Xenococcus sp. PCC 7305]|uniref:GMC family oxidoreductase N-terminal domain-containing protein n=1 Tax=Xenococcus sp. PCC 7305 TaxID=102125 RepID=UPI0002ACD470|nr:GMC family oxidoreductase [Xenococcus sp. PCC 7305]ELS04262.1 choline dehydrogenase-like flavoprotein [Xenococcus sp. PCC 7305]